MNNKFLLVFFVIFLSCFSFVSSAGTTVNVFFDGFETGTFVSNWTASASYSVSTSPTIPVDLGTYAVLANGGTTNTLMTRTNNYSLTGYSSCILTARMQINSAFDVGEYLCLDYSNNSGTTWSRTTGSDGVVDALCLDGNVDTEGVYTTVTYNISNTSSATGFKIRFRQTSNQAAEDGYMDNINLTCINNSAPTISNISLSSTKIKGGNQIIVYANTSINQVNDSSADGLTIYCSNITNAPTAANNVCSATDASYPYDLICAYNVGVVNVNETVSCRVYDGLLYSSNSPNATYEIDSSFPVLSVVNVAGDSSPGYFDSVNDGATLVNISGEEGMSCRWSSSDLAYSSMVSSCSINGLYALCNFTDILSQGVTSRYVSCQDSVLNENNATNNLDVSFTLDYTSPTTSDNSVSSIQVPTYIVTITESDNVDLDPTTYYCKDTFGNCTPTTLIDTGGTVSFTSANRGVNYFRYYSVDDAGNNQTVVNKTININQLSILSNATDNAVLIKGGASVNITSVSSDLDSSQTITLYVCNSSLVSSSGCTSYNYCNSSGSSNLSCIFDSESDSALHTWYAFLYDDLSEIALQNFSGSYTTDSTSPVITIISPLNSTYPTSNVSAEISTSEASSFAGYSLDGAANVTMTNISSTSFVMSLTNLSYGQHNIIFYANDSLGNYGFSSIRYFVIEIPLDVASPSLTIVSPANGSYTSATNTYVNVSSDESLSFAGYRLNGGSLISLSNVSTTSWYVSLTSLTEETNYTLVVYGNDTSNNQGNKTVNFNSDSLAPRYSSVSASPSASNVSGAVNCSIFWNDSYKISSVIISHNADGVYEDQIISFSGSSGYASYLISGNRLSLPGNYTCIFNATDIAGNTNSTSTPFVVSDVTSPTIIVTSPTNGGVYNQNYILLSLVSNEALTLAKYSLNGAANVTMDNTSATSWNYTLTGLSDGNYSVLFYGQDSSGNLGFSNNFLFNISSGAADTIVPVISSTISNASYKRATSFEFNISSNENLTWAGYSLNGASLIDLTNLSDILWNGTFSSLVSPSSNNLTIYGNDSSNNSGVLNLTFYVDDVSPIFVLESASPNPANETQNVLCNVYVNDSFSLSSVKISENATSPGNFINHTIDLTSSGYANYTILNLAKGNYQCIFYATDIAGNTNSSFVDFVVNDVTAPVLTINSPLNQSYSTSSILLSLTTSEVVSFAKYSFDLGLTNFTLGGSGVSWSNTSSLVDGSYTVVFYANDSFGNEGSANVTFVVDTSVNDLVSPAITVWSPTNGSYFLSSSVLLNISSDENLGWAGYENDSLFLFNLDNVSLKNWNYTSSFAEGTHNIIFYANDTSSNKNKGNRSVTFYVDLNNPSVNSFSCNSTINDSENLLCSGLFSDFVGLDYVVLSYNFSGSFVNSSHISVLGNLSTFNYTFTEGNYTPGNYTIRIYLYDLAGRINDSSSSAVSVFDDRAPTISNFSYSPLSELLLDPGVVLNVNASVVDNFEIGNVYLMYKNESSWNSILMSNYSLVNYNVSFVSPSGNVSIMINASDARGNYNLSNIFTFNVLLDTAQNITTDVDSIESITYSQRNSSNSLGKISLNNTGDTDLNFSVSVSAASDILSRFNLNSSFNQSSVYSVLHENNLTIGLTINTTDLVSGLYPFTITISSAAGTEVFSRNLNIQTSSGPYLVVSIDQYSSYVTRGQTGISAVASVTNLGTSDASLVNLYWTLPSEISLTSGSLNRYIGNLPIGVSAENSIVFSVSSTTSSSNLTFIASSNESSSTISNDSKSITVLDPITISSGTTGGGSSGGGSVNRGGIGDKIINYSKTVEILRGETDKFEINVINPYSNTSFRNVSLTLSGFLDKYVSINPSLIYELNYSKQGNFIVTIKSPRYQSYEEYDLKAVIRADIISSGSINKYYEVQYVKLIIQDMSYTQAEKKVLEAEKSVSQMNNNKFYTKDVSVILNISKEKLALHRNKEAHDLAVKIIEIKEKAFRVYDLINKLYAALYDPRKTNSLTGNVVFDSKNGSSFVLNFFGKEYLFASDSVSELLSMAVVAFNRGDYNLAEERANSAQILLILERKGNIGLFFYLYWEIVLVVIILFLGLSIILYKFFRKNKISSEISDLNHKEQEIQKLSINSQKLYFSGKISLLEYNRAISRYSHELAKLKDRRVTLRNSRVKLLKFADVSRDLDKERKEVENRIKLIQKQFYVDKKLSETEYKEEFNHSNDLLAEIEEEKVTLDLINKSKVVKK